MSIDKIDKQLLDIVQTGFPISARPYKELGESLEITEEEAFERIQNLKKEKLIRRLGANFQSSKLGFRSTLCAAKVPAEKMEHFIEVVNSYVGVTHNYLRKHEFNIWFTLIASSWDNVVSTLQEITDKTGIEILNLPATELYKIKVDFKLDEEA